MTVPNEHRSDQGLVHVRRALVSVSDKSGVIELAAALRDLTIEILSTGGTARALRQAGVAVVDVADITGFPEMLDGRVKTLHPKIHAGILASRSEPEHLRQLREHAIAPIDLVVITLYPFEATVARTNVSFEEAVEQIDIGGPSLIRAAAKNFEDVAVLVDPGDYTGLLAELRQYKGRLSRVTRLHLARKAFAHVARYDALIAGYLERNIETGGESTLPDVLDLRLFKAQSLRYGENPHQRAALYRGAEADEPSVASAKQLQGKELSFNNLLDLDAALALAREFEEPVAVIVKHTNPCGVGHASRLVDAYLHARAADPASAYGGVLGLNRAVDVETAGELSATFVEAIVAPGYEDAALATLKEKKALRLLQIEPWPGMMRADQPGRELRVDRRRDAGAGTRRHRPESRRPSCRDATSSPRGRNASPALCLEGGKTRQVKRDRPGERASHGRNRRRADEPSGRLPSRGDEGRLPHPRNCPGVRRLLSVSRRGRCGSGSRCHSDHPAGRFHS